MAQPTQQEMRVLREPEVITRAGLSHTQLWQLEKRGKFPRRFKIAPGGRACGWLEAEVLDWIRERVALRERGQPIARRAS